MAERYDFYVHDNRKITFNLTEPIMREDNHVTDWVIHIPKTLNELEVSEWSWCLVYVNAKGEKRREPLELSDDPESPLEKNIGTYSVDYGMSIKAGIVLFAIEGKNADTSGTVLNEWHTYTYEHKVKETIQGDDAEYDDSQKDVMAALIVQVQTKMNQVIGGATPTPVNLKSQMTDPKAVYLYIGSEPNEHAGHWYYHNGTTFVPGGVYGAGVTDAVPTQGSTNAVQSGGVYSALDTLQAEIPTVDSTPTQGSNNAVSSGGVYEALAGKVNAETGKGLSTNDYSDAEKQKVTDATADLSAMTSATAEDVGKALKAKTVSGGKVTEWEFGEAGGSNNEYVTNIKKNLIDKDACVLGSFNQSTGEVVPWNSRYVTDFIPIVPNVDIYRSSVRWGWACYYTESKEYISGANGYINGYITVANAAYVRLQMEASQFETALFSLAKYYNAQTDENGYVKTLLNDTASEILADSYNVYAEADTEKFIKTENLFDYYSDTYFIKATVNANTGVYTYNVWDSDIPDSANAYIGIADYYPVSYGQVLFCNYDYWDSAYYDENKTYMGKITSSGAYVGWVVPEGCAYVRLNIKGSNADPTPSGRIGNISEMKNLMIYTKNASQTNMPAVAWKPNYQLDGKYVAPNYLDTVTPSMTDSDFLSAMKCMTIREINKRDHAYRFGNFNMWVTVGTKGWENTRKMLMDYGVDFCGFEEVYHSNNELLAEFLKSWQFPYGFDTNYTDGTDSIDKSFVSRYQILSSTKFYTTSSGTSVSLLNSKVQLPRLLDVYHSKRILSVYIVHLPITSDAKKVSVANEILAIIANDTSDYIVIFGDTNDFANNEEGKLYWRTFEGGGFRPVLPITSKTVTQDNFEEVEGDPSQKWRHHAIDQFLISSNIDAVAYGVINTKDEYYLSSVSGSGTDNQPALSDHDFVYADLVFKDEVRSGLVQSGE